MSMFTLQFSTFISQADYLHSYITKFFAALKMSDVIFFSYRLTFSHEIHLNGSQSDTGIFLYGHI
jgi:hypothetical protein